MPAGAVHSRTNDVLYRHHRHAVASAAVGGWFDIAKFIVLILVLVSVLVWCGVRRNNARQEMVELGRELNETLQETAELHKRYDNSFEELSRLKGGDNITRRARRLGLRPTESGQQVNWSGLARRGQRDERRGQVAQF